MHRWLFLAWVFLEIQAIEAQVKDTLRENIDYRGFRSFYDGNRKSNALPFKNSQSANQTLSILGSRPKDTLRQEINYRRNVGFYRSYKFKRGSMFNHYLGLQVNSIFHELSKPDSAYIDNPYVLTYSANHKLKGFGLGLGYGYTEWGNKYFNASDNEVASANSRVNFRIGLDKKHSFGKRIGLGVGLDIVYSQNKFIKKTFVNAFVDEAYARTTGWGFGPRASVFFSMTKWLGIGTETSYYFKKWKSKSYTRFTGLPPENVTESSESSFSFLAPFSIFIVFRI